MSDWILILVAGAWAAADTTAFLQIMVHQPLAVGTLLGAAVGVPLEGAYLGALLQLLWIADLPIGAAVFPDRGPAAAGAIGGGLLALGPGTVGMGTTGLTVLVVAIPMAWAAGLTVTVEREFGARFSTGARKAVSIGRPRAMRRYLFAGIGVAAARGALIAAIGALASFLLLGAASHLTGMPEIAPFTLLAGVLGLGLAQAMRLFELRENWIWLLAGSVTGLLGIVLF